MVRFNKKAILILIILLIIVCVLFSGCNQKIKEEPKSPSPEIPSRENLIPADAIKIYPENDELPPKLHSDEYEESVPLSYPVNTKGVEDSAFIMPDGNTIYVWFTPNNRMDVSEQSQDMVTGIYKFKKQSHGWSDAIRIWLVEPGKPHLDGCGFFQGNKLWICGVREGYTGLHWFTSEFKDGEWSIAEISNFNPEYEVGELHISKDGGELYFHSSRQGGKGGLDIWMSKKVNGKWQEPKNLEKVNSEYDEGWPTLNVEEDELWITKNHGLWRSRKVDGEWRAPEKIISNLAGEATIDKDGNIYFTHYYYENDKMIESDIYVAYKK